MVLVKFVGEGDIMGSVTASAVRSEKIITIIFRIFDCYQPAPAVVRWLRVPTLLHLSHLCATRLYYPRLNTRYPAL